MSGGFTLLEILISLAILLVIGVAAFSIQSSTWKRVVTSTHLTVAGQMIERQIEQLRMNVSVNPNLYFPPSDSSYVENGITLSWTHGTVTRPHSATTLTDVMQYTFTAAWGKKSTDSLRVTTCISKLF